MSFFAFTSHNHMRCVEYSFREVQKECLRKSLRLTRTRKRVLEILLEAHRAMAAYDILKQLSVEGIGSQPPVVYRALDFLVKYDFVHKIQSYNSYIACSHLAISHIPFFLICRQCKAIAEEIIDAQNIDKIAPQKKGFLPEESVIEICGLCPDCADQKCHF